MSFSPGGSGGISGASDVALSAPSNNHALTYDSATQKRKNAPVTINHVDDLQAQLDVRMPIRVYTNQAAVAADPPAVGTIIFVEQI